ncbi:MAG TPA: hypothetical protein VN938_09570, partial [Xanthobacteraceae bacterium]|nr:hypothetical protein [Xanthobacteraceae bacterium]
DSANFYEDSFANGLRTVGSSDPSSYSVHYEVSKETFVAVSSTTANLITTELFGRLHASGKDIKSSPITPTQLGTVAGLIVKGTISGKTAKDVLEIVWNEGGDPRAIVEQRGLQQVSDVSAIEMIVNDIIAKNPDKVGDAKSNPKAIGWFVGQVMKASGGKANPQVVNELLRKRLGT